MYACKTIVRGYFVIVWVLKKQNFNEYTYNKKIYSKTSLPSSYFKAYEREIVYILFSALKGLVKFLLFRIYECWNKSKIYIIFTIVHNMIISVAGIQWEEWVNQKFLDFCWRNLVFRKSKSELTYLNRYMYASMPCYNPLQPIE